MHNYKMWVINWCDLNKLKNQQLFVRLQLEPALIQFDV